MRVRTKPFSFFSQKEPPYQCNIGKRTPDSMGCAEYSVSSNAHPTVQGTRGADSNGRKETIQPVRNQAEGRKLVCVSHPVEYKTVDCGGCHGSRDKGIVGALSAMQGVVTNIPR